MAGIGNSHPTLLDVASRMEKDAIARTIIELMSETNEVLQDLVVQECNDGSSHKTTVRSGLPQGTWRKLNYGVQPEKSTTTQVKDACGMLESYSKIDASLLALARDKPGFRLSEERAFIEGLQQTFMNTLLYGDTSINPERFMGLAPRFNSLTAENGDNILDGGGKNSDNTSVWLVVFGELGVHGLYPSGSQAGLQVKDLGEDTVSDGNGGEYQAFRTHFKWDCGLTVRDWRQVVRIANIDVKDLTKDAQSGADLIDLMVQAIETVHNLNLGKPVFLVNRTIRSFLRRQMLYHKNVLLSLDEVAGKKVLTFDGIPVRRCDAILNNEATVA